MTNSSQLFKSHWLNRVDEYRHSPRVYFGIGAINKVGEVAKEIAGNTDTIIITDKMLSKIGLIEKPRKILEEFGFTVELYESTEKEPLIGEVKEIINALRDKNYGLVIGIGGGSAMDKAKMYAVMAETPGELEEYVCPNDKPLKGSKPKLLIPTTAGTGSECSNTAVVIVPEKDVEKTKTWITGNPVLADASIIDPSLMVKLPPRGTAGSGMDAMSHTAEAVLSLQANPFSDAIALKAVELVSQNLRSAYTQGDNFEARGNMALAAAIGGMVISYPWVAGPATLGHVASEGISARYGIPHGEACGVLLPYVYWYNLPDDYGKRKIAKIAEAIGEDVSGLTVDESAKRAIIATFNLLEDVGLPSSLKDYDITTRDIPVLSKYILARAEEMYSMSEYNPRKATLENVQEFFNKAIEGRESIGF